MKVPVKKPTNANSLESPVNLEEQIRYRACELYVQRGYEAGHETEDWLAAEAELTRERTQPLGARAFKTSFKVPATSTEKSKARYKKSSFSV